MKSSRATALFHTAAGTALLVTRNPPNAGVLNPVCPLGVAVSGPVSFSIVASAMDHTNENLAEVTATSLVRSIGVSDRTLRRLFLRETGMTWREYLVQSRLLRAMVLLAEPGPNVLEVAQTVGFASPSAFNRAFTRYTGESPSSYRRRVTTPPP